MGTPGPPNTPAFGCARCFGDGGIIGGVQPRYVDLTFSGVQPGPGIDDAFGPLANGRERLIHTTGCTYQIRHFDYQVLLSWTSASTLVRWLDGSSALHFRSFTPSDLCMTSVQNAVTFGPFIQAFGGSCKITWPLEGL